MPSEKTPSPTSLSGMTCPSRNAVISRSLSGTTSGDIISAACSASVAAASTAGTAPTPRFMPTMTVRMNGTAMATAALIANASIKVGWIERMPGRPPTPMAFAVVPIETQRMAAHAEPVMPQRNGK